MLHPGDLAKLLDRCGGLRALMARLHSVVFPNNQLSESFTVEAYLSAFDGP